MQSKTENQVTNSNLDQDIKAQTVDKIVKVCQQLNAFKPTTQLDSLNLFENQLTIYEMEECFLQSEPEELNTNLVRLLSLRWERIRSSNMCYTQQPTNSSLRPSVDFHGVLFKSPGTVIFYQ